MVSLIEARGGRGTATRVLVLGLGSIALASLAGGCGSSFPLPTERRISRSVPEDKKYQMIATWTGMVGVTDVLLTQGGGAQLFLLFNHGRRADPHASRGEVRAYPLTRKAPFQDIVFPGLFNPVTLCAGGSKIFVLDQGDTCLARADTLPPHGCGDRPGWSHPVTDLSAYWRVREYPLLGGDTISTFTDTSVAFVRGVAADDEGSVYVSGIVIIEVPYQGDTRYLTRTFFSQIYKYRRGPRYPGVRDYNMPGANWHRDTTWVIEEGSGVGTLVDPRGMYWSPAGSGALYSTDFGNNPVQKLSDRLPNTGYYGLDGAQSGLTFNGPTAVSVDLDGYVYVTDAGNRRVLRFGPDEDYIQRVDLEPDSAGRPLDNPVAAAANDSVVYVADFGAGEVLRFQRRK